MFDTRFIFTQDLGDFMAQEKKQSFMKGAAILSASTLLVKILGLLVSIPLAKVILLLHGL